MRQHCPQLLEAPPPRTAIIRQVPIVAAHIVCALMEGATLPRAVA
jgi:hypothetical protein